jgi:hypothetical protein
MRSCQILCRAGARNEHRDQDSATRNRTQSAREHKEEHDACRQEEYGEPSRPCGKRPPSSQEPPAGRIGRDQRAGDRNPHNTPEAGRAAAAGFKLLVNNALEAQAHSDPGRIRRAPRGASRRHVPGASFLLRPRLRRPRQPRRAQDDDRPGDCRTGQRRIRRRAEIFRKAGAALAVGTVPAGGHAGGAENAALSRLRRAGSPAARDHRRGDSGGWPRQSQRGRPRGRAYRRPSEFEFTPCAADRKLV